MKKNTCTNCENRLSENAMFCGECGTQARCTNCKEQIGSGIKFCEACGTRVISRANTEASNTFTFQETADSRTVNAAFTDPVAKEMTETLGNFLTARQLALSGSPISSKPLGSENGKVGIDPDPEEFEDIPSITGQNMESKVDNEQSIPDIKNLVYKRLPKSEAEWMLIYACYSSNFIVGPVTPQTLKDFYVKTDRKTDSNQKNFRTNLNSLVKTGLIEFINDEQFVVTEEGFSKGREIINRTTVTPSTRKKSTAGSKNTNKSSSTKTKSTSKTQSLSLVNNLNLHPKGKKSLEDFYAQFVVKSNLEKNLVFIYYLEKVLGEKEIGMNHVYTCYKKVGQRVPGQLYQSLLDTKNRKGWIETKDISKLRITTGGENGIEHDLKRKE